MRKPVYAICEQQRFRSDCAAKQPGQQFFVHCFNSIIPIVAKPKVSSLSLVSVAEQTGSSFNWSYTMADRFSRHEAQIKLVLMRGIQCNIKSLECKPGFRCVTSVAAEVIITVSNRLQLLDART